MAVQRVVVGVGIGIPICTLDVEVSMEPWPPSEQDFVDVLRARRAELRESMAALEQALAAPAHERIGAWAERVHVALVELFGDFREHIEITEGQDGLYRRVLTTAPRLSNAVANLTREHEQVRSVVDDLLARVDAAETRSDVNRVRGVGIVLLGRLIRHRQHGSDLMYEAYESDIGGET